MRFTDKVAVITAFANGIGRATAEIMAREGATVVGVDNHPDRLATAVAVLREAGGKAHGRLCDALDAAQAESTVASVEKEFGAVDILVNAAGFTFRQPTMSLCDEQLSKMFDTNLTGALRACQSFFEPLKASGSGRVINIASLGSFLAFYEVAAYCATKTALLSLTRSLAIEWAQDKICVNAIAPGIFPTDLNQEIINGTPRGNEMLMRTPMRRFGNPEELVGAAVLLASDAASFITGQCITVDGGFLASGVNT